jgi:uncharacterized protein
MKRAKLGRLETEVVRRAMSGATLRASVLLITRVRGHRSRSPLPAARAQGAAISNQRAKSRRNHVFRTRKENPNANVLSCPTYVARRLWVKDSDYYSQALAEAQGRDADLHKALRLLNRACKQGDSRAAYALGTWHLHGKEALVPKNLAKAIPLLRVAADADHAEAAYDLAVCYEKGTGVKKSEKKAALLYLKAALLGDKQSIYEVGRCYWYGLGVERDRSIAGAWLDHAAKLNIKK